MPIIKEFTQSNGVVYSYHKVVGLTYDRTKDVLLVTLGSYVSEEHKTQGYKYTLLFDVFAFAANNRSAAMQMVVNTNAVESALAEKEKETKLTKEEKTALRSELEEIYRQSEEVVLQDLNIEYNEKLTADEILAMVYTKIMTFKEFEGCVASEK